MATKVGDRFFSNPCEVLVEEVDRGQARAWCTHCKALHWLDAARIDNPGDRRAIWKPVPVEGSS